MTHLLDQAFRQAAALSDPEQDALARWLLQELEAERTWAQKLEQSPLQLGQLASEAIEEVNRGTVKPMDESQFDDASDS